MHGIKDNKCSLSQNRHTLLVYMGGDNNLFSEVVQKMLAVLLFDHSNDTIKSHKVNMQRYRDIINQPSPRNKCSYGEASATLVATCRQEHAALAPAFSRVLEDYKHYAPADRYGLIVFLQASDWLPEGMLNNPNRSDTRSVVVDGISEMGINDFTSTIYAC